MFAEVWSCFAEICCRRSIFGPFLLSLGLLRQLVPELWTCAQSLHPPTCLETWSFALVVSSFFGVFNYCHSVTFIRHSFMFHLCEKLSVSAACFLIRPCLSNCKWCLRFIIVCTYIFMWTRMRVDDHVDHVDHADHVFMCLCCVFLLIQAIPAMWTFNISHVGAAEQRSGFSSILASQLDFTASTL